jgi:hypothetical protein
MRAMWNNKFFHGAMEFEKSLLSEMKLKASTQIIYSAAAVKILE